MVEKSDIRARLRKSTVTIHERLHRHEGFAAVVGGSIELVDYQRLLSRLWGFHRAFESALSQVDHGPDIGIDFKLRRRSSMLASDLGALGWDRTSILCLPLCKSLRAPRNTAEFMGALYVVEGSTLGGIQLARALTGLVTLDSGAGRNFFLGYGDHHGAMWRSFLARLEDCASSEAACTSIIDVATRTFLDFEVWMAGWKAEAFCKAISPPTASSQEDLMLSVTPVCR